MTRLWPLLLGSFAFLIPSAQAQEPRLPPHIAVPSAATAEVTPDVAVLRLGVSTERRTAAEAATANARSAQGLIDEVAAGLTEQEVESFIALVRRIRDMGISVVWIEHVMRTMLTATDRLMALAGGEVLALGAPDEVIARPEVKRVYLGA